MDNLFALLILVGIGGFFYFRKKDKKKRNISIVIAVISFVLFGVTSPEVQEGVEEGMEQVAEDDAERTKIEETQAEQADTQEAEQEPEEENTEEPQEVYDTYFEQRANEVWENNLVDFTYNDLEGYVSMTSKIEDGWSGSTMKRSFYMQALAYAESVQDEDFNELFFVARVEMQDQYGNADDMNVIKIGLTKETVDKINFENFQTDNLENVADTVDVHQAFQDD